MISQHEMLTIYITWLAAGLLQPLHAGIVSDWLTFQGYPVGKPNNSSYFSLVTWLTWIQNLCYKCLTFYFQRYCCTVCAAAVAGSMWSCSIRYSMHWPSLVLLWVSSQFLTLIILILRGPSPISTRCTVGWVWSQWGYSHFRYIVW